MRFSTVWITPVLAALLSFSAAGQGTETREAPTETKGMPARATAGDYQAQAAVGSLTLAAEFAGHSVPKPEGPLSTEDFVIVEAAFFGPAGEKAKLSIGDFSLRINGKKNPLPSQPYGLVARSLKDPQWSPPEEEAPKQKSKTGLSTGGQNSDGGSLPVVVHVPIELQRAMAQYIQKSSLPQGDRTLPQAGLLFFEYRGKTSGIHSLELIYAGPAGKATLTLQP